MPVFIPWPPAGLWICAACCVGRSGRRAHQGAVIDDDLAGTSIPFGMDAHSSSRVASKTPSLHPSVTDRIGLMRSLLLSGASLSAFLLLSSAAHAKVLLVD